jgi:hypothetical protein
MMSARGFHQDLKLKFSFLDFLETVFQDFLLLLFNLNLKMELNLIAIEKELDLVIVLTFFEEMEDEQLPQPVLLAYSLLILLE